MKIFNDKPEGNEAAELENALYFNLAIKNIEESCDYLKTTDKPIQVMLTHIDILICLCHKFEINANLLLKKKRIEDWKNTFFQWYDRVNSKIPKQFREGIHTSAVQLFNELSKYGH